MVIARSQALAPALLFASVLASSTLAHAQASTGELRDHESTSRIAVELGYYHWSVGMSEVELFQPSFYGSFRLAAPTETTFVDLDVAWRAAGSAGDGSAFRAGNPYVGVRAGMHDRENGFRVRGGLGLTAPLTNLYDDYRGGLLGDGFVGIFTLALGGAMQGAWDAWLTVPLNMAVVARGDVEWRQEYFDLGAEVGFGALLPVEYEGQTGDTTLALQGAAWAAGRPIPELAIGARFQAVMIAPTGEDMDSEGYLALVPFVRGEIGAGFVEGRLVMNLDDPYGFAFDDEGIWAVYVSGGADF